MAHFVATLIYLSHNYSYHIRGDRSPLTAKVWYISRRLGAKGSHLPL